MIVLEDRLNYLLRKLTVSGEESYVWENTEAAELLFKAGRQLEAMYMRMARDGQCSLALYLDESGLPSIWPIPPQF